MSKIHRDYGIAQKIESGWQVWRRTFCLHKIERQSSQKYTTNFKRLKLFQCTMKQCMLIPSLPHLPSSRGLKIKAQFFFGNRLKIERKKHSDSQSLKKRCADKNVFKDFIYSFIHIFWASSRDTTVWTRLALHINFNHVSALCKNKVIRRLGACIT